MIQASNITFSYEYEEIPCLKGVSVSAEPGEFIAVIGQNGSGKSTLVKHINALLELQTGSLTVSGLDASRKENIWKLRRKVGMVFQNPDNQFVSSVAGEDIAFGMENYGVPKEEIPARTKAALSRVGLEGFEERSVHTLSGGEKQRLALAGVLALEPDILVFDEASSMLDPEGRRGLLETMHRLRGEGRTIITVTHYIEETVEADRIYLMKDGKVLKQGKPREILTDKELLLSAGMAPTLPVQMYYDLKDRGICLPFCPLTEEELAEELCRLL